MDLEFLDLDDLEGPDRQRLEALFSADNPNVQLLAPTDHLISGYGVKHGGSPRSSSCSTPPPPQIDSIGQEEREEDNQGSTPASISPKHPLNNEHQITFNNITEEHITVHNHNEQQTSIENYAAQDQDTTSGGSSVGAKPVEEMSSSSGTTFDITTTTAITTAVHTASPPPQALLTNVSETPCSNSLSPPPQSSQSHIYTSTPSNNSSTNNATSPSPSQNPGQTTPSGPTTTTVAAITSTPVSYTSSVGTPQTGKIQIVSREYNVPPPNTGATPVIASAPREPGSHGSHQPVPRQPSAHVLQPTAPVYNPQQPYPPIASPNPAAGGAPTLYNPHVLPPPLPPHQPVPTSAFGQIPHPVMHPPAGPTVYVQNCHVNVAPYGPTAANVHNANVHQQIVHQQNVHHNQYNVQQHLGPGGSSTNQSPPVVQGPMLQPIAVMHEPHLQQIQHQHQHHHHHHHKNIPDNKGVEYDQHKQRYEQQSPYQRGGYGGRGRGRGRGGRGGGRGRGYPQPHHERSNSVSSDHSSYGSEKHYQETSPTQYTPTGVPQTQFVPNPYAQVYMPRGTFPHPYPAGPAPQNVAGLPLMYQQHQQQQQFIAAAAHYQQQAAAAAAAAASQGHLVPYPQVSTHSTLHHQQLPHGAISHHQHPYHQVHPLHHPQPPHILSPSPQPHPHFHQAQSPFPHHPITNVAPPEQQQQQFQTPPNANQPQQSQLSPVVASLSTETQLLENEDLEIPIASAEVEVSPQGDAKDESSFASPSTTDNITAEGGSDVDDITCQTASMNIRDESLESESPTIIPTMNIPSSSPQSLVLPSIPGAETSSSDDVVQTVVTEVVLPTSPVEVPVISTPHEGSQFIQPSSAPEISKQDPILTLPNCSPGKIEFKNGTFSPTTDLGLTFTVDDEVLPLDSASCKGSTLVTDAATQSVAEPHVAPSPSPTSATKIHSQVKEKPKPPAVEMPKPRTAPQAVILKNSNYKIEETKKISNFHASPMVVTSESVKKMSQATGKLADSGNSSEIVKPIIVSATSSIGPPLIIPDLTPHSTTGQTAHSDQLLSKNVVSGSSTPGPISHSDHLAKKNVVSGAPVPPAISNKPQPPSTATPVVHSSVPLCGAPGFHAAPPPAPPAAPPPAPPAGPPPPPPPGISLGPPPPCEDSPSAVPQGAWGQKKSWSQLFTKTQEEGAAKQVAYVAPFNQQEATLSTAGQQEQQQQQQQQQQQKQHNQQQQQQQGVPQREPVVPQALNVTAASTPPLDVLKTTIGPNVADGDVDKVKMGEMLQSYIQDHRHMALQPRGLINKGYWCYVNAPLQALLACPPFYNLMTSIPNISGLKKAKSSTPVIDSISEYVHEFGEMSTILKPNKKDKDCKGASGPKVPEIVSGSAFEPSYVYKLLTSMNGDLFTEGRQQDAEEMLSCVLNGLHDEMVEALKLAGGDLTNGGLNGIMNGEDSDHEEVIDDDDEWQVMGPKKRSVITRTAHFTSSPISNIFWGQMRSNLQQAGGQVTANLQPFTTVPLDIQNPEVESVRDALDQLVSREDVAGYTCSKTNQEVAVSKQVVFEQLPNIMILQMKRFIYDKDGGLQKVSKKVSFPLNLEMTKELLSANSRGKYSATQRKFKLLAVVYHDGKEATKGHYVADIYHSGYNCWLHYDDSMVTAVPEHLVLKHAPPRVPYLLFYRRCDTMVGATTKAKT